ncbi:MAG TPA: GGDEF domain-containing protein, partial [Rhodocyclaceae bacterium]|nr:GGDEF domain-containing protein [Rhodocyclaceae bacterium]
MLLLDVRTLIVVFIVGNLLVGSLMLAAFRGHLTPVLRYWIGSLFVQALGWVLLARCGGALPLLGFFLMSVNYGLMLTAFALQFGVSRRHAWPWWPVGAALLFCLFAPDEIWQRQAIGAVISGVQVLLAALVVLRSREGSALLRGLIAASGLVGAGMLLTRAVNAYALGAAECLSSNTPGQSLMFLSFFVFRFTFMFGFILLIEGKQREAVTRLATLDPLTGIYNRRTFIDLAGRELQRSQRNRKPIALVAFDLDHFKDINDTLGHQAGDLVLCHVRRVVQDCLRSHDVFARYGGEEFVIL